MREAANRKLEVEAENSRLVSELRSQNKTDALLKDTDSNKALELAETRAMSLEKQVSHYALVIRGLLSTKSPR